MLGKLESETLNAFIYDTSNLTDRLFQHQTADTQRIVDKAAKIVEEFEMLFGLGDVDSRG